MTDNANAPSSAVSVQDTSVPVLSDTPEPSAAPITILNPSASPSTQPAAVLPAVKSTPDTGKSSVPLKPKPQAKARRAKARPRRRAVASDDESEPEGGVSDSSLTDASSASEEELDDEDLEVKDDVERDAPGTAFKDVSSITPAGWVDGSAVNESESAEVTFDEFNRGESGRGRGSARGKGRGRGGAAGQQRELTEEEQTRIDEAKKRRKEKVKAKRAEQKETRRKEREAKADSSAQPEVAEGKKITATPAATAKEAKIKGKKKPEGPVRTDSGVSGLVASTSALTLEDATTPAAEIPEPIPEDPAAEAAVAPAVHPPKGRPNNRDAYTQRLAADPKFTPRVGGFWTHDQRLYDAGPVGEGGYSGLRQMSEYWRGRAGAPRGFRGGFRGRGRGFPAGPFAPGGFGHRKLGQEKEELAANVEGKEKGDEPVLAMDRVEAELAAKEIRSPPAEEAVVVPPKEQKWGHEAFEAIQTESTRRLAAGAGRGAIRGRARGRGGFAPRGGHFIGAVRPVDPPTPLSTPGSTHANVPSLASQPSRPQLPVTNTATTTKPSAAVSSAELQSTHPGADSLLDDDGQALTIKLPGSDKAVEVSVPSHETTVEVDQSITLARTSEVAPAASANGQAILYSSPVPPAPSVVQQLSPPAQPQPRVHPQVAALTNGSLNSTLASAPAFHPASIPHPHSQPSPFPTASDSGSISSTGQFAPPPVVPAAMGYPSANGAGFHPGRNQPRAFYPNGADAAPRAYPSHQQANFYSQRQAYAQEQFQPHHGHRGSFSGPAQYYGQPPSASGYSDGRNSPYNGSPNPYAIAQSANLGAGSQQLGYFAPARPTTKVSIRPPQLGQAAGKGKSNLDASTPAFASLNDQQQQYMMEPLSAQAQAQYYSQHYNPYTAQQLQAQGQLDGYEAGQAYYPASGVANGVPGYGWEGQAQGGMGNYGYEGEYGY